MKLFVAVYDDCTLLPQFLRYYRRLGVTTFVIAVDRAVAVEVRREARSVDAIVRDDLDVADSVRGGTKAVTQMRADYASPHEWTMIVDLDEFAWFNLSVQEICARAESEHANVVRGQMIDRVSADGSLPSINAQTDLCRLFPRKCRLTSLLQGSVDFKGVLVKGHLAATMAHHMFAEERVATQVVELHHFKWTAAAPARLLKAMEMARVANISWWTEYERVLNHLAVHGRIRWEDFVENESCPSAGFGQS